MRRSRWSASVVVLCLLGGALVGCSDDGDGEGGEGAGATSTTVESTTTTEAPAEPLRIVVSNDDGIESQGIDLLVEALTELDDVEVTVVAPVGDRSGSSDQTTPEGAPYRDAATLGGVEGTAVEGFPADSVPVALDELGLEPHVVVSGVNEGHNIGPLAQISGTVGVARTAIRRGVPAIAASAGLEFDEAQFQVAVDLVVEWIEEHRDALLAGEVGTEQALSINVPACPPEQMGEPVEVPLAEAFPEGANPFESTCDLSVDAPSNDFEALTAGYPTMTEVPAEL